MNASHIKCILFKSKFMAEIYFNKEVRVISIADESDKLPCEQIKEFLETKIYLQPMNSTTKLNFVGVIDNLKFKIKIKNNLSDEEFQQLDIPYKIELINNENKWYKEGGSKICVKARNMFTACLLFGKYVPYWLVKNKPKEFLFSDCDKVIYHDGKYFLIKADPNKMKTREEIMEMSKIERERYYNEDKSISIDISNVVKTEKEYETHKDELRREIELLGKSSIHKIVVNEIERRKQIEVSEFELKFEVPYGSVKLEVGKNYMVYIDGEMKIKTVNGELWAFPPTCGSIDEEY